MRERRIIALGVALVLADVAIVALALPELLQALHTSIVGVAAVLFLYLAVLAAAAPLAARFAGRSPRALAVGGFTLASAACVLATLASSLPLLLVARALGAAGAGCGVAGAFSLVDGAGSGRGLWQLASLGGTAVGPALGGVLTQAFSWRAIFAVQVPVLLLAAAVAARSGRVAPVRGAPVLGAEVRQARPARRGRWELVLALLSASLAGALFLLVLVLVAGWNLSPLAAAATVSVLPLAAGASSRLRVPAGQRVPAGCALTGSGVLALAFLPGAGPAWAIVPQLMAGAGAGLALPALSGELLPERSTAEAVRQLAIRSAGVAAFLAVIAPVVAARLSSATRDAELQGIALVLDARLSPQAKFAVAPGLASALRSQDVRASLDRALAQYRGRFKGADLAVYERLGRRGDQLVVGVVQGSFEGAFVLAGALGLLAALLAAPLGARGLAAPPEAPRVPRVGDAAGPLGATLVLVLAVPLVYVALRSAEAPAPVRIAPPCQAAPLPGSGGVSGFLQDRAIELLDTAACHLGTTREELVLAAADPAEGRRFARAHGGVDPHSLIAPVLNLLGSL